MGEIQNGHQSMCAICINFIWLVYFIGDSRIILMQIQTMWQCIEPPTYIINTWGCLCPSFVSSVQKKTTIWKRKIMDRNNHDNKNEPSNVLGSLKKSKGSFMRYVCILWVTHFNSKFHAFFNQSICLFIAFDKTIHTVWRCQKWSPWEVGW